MDLQIVLVMNRFSSLLYNARSVSYECMHTLSIVYQRAPTGAKQARKDAIPQEVKDAKAAEKEARRLAKEAEEEERVQEQARAQAQAQREAEERAAEAARVLAERQEAAKERQRQEVRSVCAFFSRHCCSGSIWTTWCCVPWLFFWCTSQLIIVFPS
jgi:hypothetical protein